MIYEPIQVFEGDGIDRCLPPKTFFLFDYPISVEDESATHTGDCAFLSRNLKNFQIAHRPGLLQVIFETKYKNARDITNPKGYKIKEIWIKDVGIFKSCIVTSVDAIVLDADSLAVNYKTTISFDYFMKA